MRRKPNARWYEFSSPSLGGWVAVFTCSATRPTVRGVIASAVFLLVLALLVGSSWAGESQQADAKPSESHHSYVLSVPGSSQPLHLAVALPRGASHDPAYTWHLVEIDVLKTELPTLLVDGLTKAGLADERRQQLLVTIPAGSMGRQRPVDVPRRFRLVAAHAAEDSHQPRTPAFRFEAVNDRALAILEGDKRTLVYNHGTITGAQVPKEDPRSQRSSYIHPVCGIHGEVLTDDFPRDHYHHHGLFWTWPHVEIAGKSYDLWTDRGIEQRFVRWLEREAAGSAGVRLGVENGWFVADQQVMIERVWVYVYPTQGDCRALDLYFTWIPTRHAITLQGAAGKSYGGLTMRFAVKKPTDATITTPAGVAAADLPDTPLPWADLTATFAGQSSPSGAALFVPLDHPDYPPTWLLRHYGPLCVGWPGVKAKSFPAGKPIQLKYRVWIHDGQRSVEQIGQAYQAFVRGLAATWLNAQTPVSP